MRAQAELVAQMGTSMFVRNFEALVTRDFLDARLAEQGARLELRFAEQDARFERKFDRLFVLGTLTVSAVLIPQLQQLLAWLL